MKANQGKRDMRNASKALFWSALGLLALSLLMTVIGSAVNQDAVLNAGIIAWLATSCLLSAWIVLGFWARAERYRK